MLRNEQIIDLQISAYNEKNIENFMAFYSPKLKIHHCNKNNEKQSNYDDFFKDVSNLFNSSPNLHCEIKNRIIQGDFIIDHEEISGFHGHAEAVTAVITYYIKNSLIHSVWIFF